MQDPLGQQISLSAFTKHLTNVSYDLPVQQAHQATHSITLAATYRPQAQDQLEAMLWQTTLHPTRHTATLSAVLSARTLDTSSLDLSTTLAWSTAGVATQWLSSLHRLVSWV